MNWSRAVRIAAPSAALVLALAAFGHLSRPAGGWRLEAVPLGGWLLAAGAMALSYAMRAMRLRAEWRGRRELKAGRCLQVILLHAAAVNLLPMRAGELGFPVLLHRCWRIPLADAAGSLLWMRLQDAAVLAWLCALSLLLVLAGKGTLGAMPAAAAGLALSAVLLAVALHGAAWSRRLLWRWRELPPEGAHRLRRWIGLAASAVAHGSARAGASTWAWSAGNWLVKVSGLAGLLWALAGGGAIAAWCAALGGEVAGALPVQPPAGLGSYEAAVVLAGSVAGDGFVQRLLPAALVLHLFVLGASVLGAALAWPGMPQASAPRTGDAA